MSHVFITGATGLLGSQIVARLLQQDRRVAVLVRPTANASGRERMKRVLTGLEETLGIALPRPVVIEGDLPAPRCGVSDVDTAWIGRNCSAVLHCAASLEFVGPDRTAEPWRTNVDGTRMLLDLTRRAGIDEWHSVSTAYVCGPRFLQRLRGQQARRRDPSSVCGIPPRADVLPAGCDRG